MDLISRQDAIDAVNEQRPSAVVSTKNWDDMIVESMIRNAVRAIKDLPSAEPKEQLIKKILSFVEDGEDCERLIELVEQM